MECRPQEPKPGSSGALADSGPGLPWVFPFLPVLLMATVGASFCYVGLEEEDLEENYMSIRSLAKDESNTSCRKISPPMTPTHRWTQNPCRSQEVQTLCRKT